MVMILSLLGIFVIAVVVNPSLRRQWNDMIDFSKENTIQLDKDESLTHSWGGKTIRLSIWKCSLDILKKNWLTGVGTGDEQAALNAAYEKRKFYFATMYNEYNAHNQYIQEAIAHGVIGLIIFVSCIFLPLITNFRQKIKTVYSIFLISFAFVCLTESMLELSKGIIWYSFFNSLFFFEE